MRVGELIMTLIMSKMTWKSTSLSGWEYLMVWEDLGSSLLYVIFVLLLVVILI